MFTRKDFGAYLQELRAVETAMARHYAAIVDDIDDETLRLRFTGLMQSENEHARLLDDLEEIARGRSAIVLPPLKWTIGRKVAGLVVFLSTALVGIFVYTHWQQTRIADELATTARVDMPLTEAVTTIHTRVLAQHLIIEKCLRLQRPDTPSDAQATKGFEATFREHTASIAERADQGLSLLDGVRHVSPSARRAYGRFHQSLQQLQTQHSRFSAEAGEVLKLIRLGEPRIDAALIGGLESTGALVAEQADTLLRDIARFTAASAMATERRERQVRLTMWTGIAGAVLSGVLVAVLLIRQLNRNLAALAGGAGAIAESFVADEIPDKRLQVRSTDEVRLLAHVLNTMIDAFSNNLRRRQRLEAELEMTSSTDRLTGVQNRRKCEETLTNEVARAARYETPLAVILFDVDHFKQVNDSYGHEAGDDVLKGIARRVQQALRQSDLLFRFGGEEFLVVAPNTGPDGATTLAEKLRTAVAQTDFPPAGSITVSLGVSVFQRGDHERSLVKRADDALYEAKRAGRNRVVGAH